MTTTATAEPPHYSPPDADACRPFLAKIAATHLAELLAPCATCKGAKRVDAEHAGGHPVCRTCRDDTDLDGVCRATKPCPDCDKPRRHDDGPRLVFADWLEERGDPWGEFIRLSVECPQFEVINYNGEGRMVDNPEFIRRRGELIARHGAAWARVVLGEVWNRPAECWGSAGVTSSNSARWDWHGGLPADFTLPLDAWRGQKCVSCYGPDGSLGHHALKPFKSCPRCHGSGFTTPPLGPKLLATAPVRVEGLRFGDKRPWKGDGVWVWWADRPAEGEVLLPRHRLPDEFGLTYKRFPTETAAHDALARAAIRWAVQQVAGQ